MNSSYLKIVSLASERNLAGVANAQMELYVERMKMDKFFTMFLDKFEGKMDPENTNTPVWNLYKKKMKEYDAINQSIKAADYYLKR